ncbi:hypothetical protein COLU111180_07335 [Cohnella lubricantis]|uniref:Uncharacterized protein n=1 Tax=Cohnella lubricantis TaxID=2163172 RepID=A0A841THW3_9BACL|nr:hypothetical protein [Cohnella lubricantis]MBB6678537.1 hypothetical protein [Cohnella lubricantis]MBP2119154.1 hypothetical protein [Cohnella lubricantis]
MSLAVYIARTLIQNKLHSLALNHLNVRVHSRSIFIYSTENEEPAEAYRAAMTLLPHNMFLLSIANHRGKWQPLPYVGTAPELLDVLTNKLAFALVRWS